MYCLDQGVKRITDDFDGAMVRRFCWVQLTIGLKELRRLAESWDVSKVLSGNDSAMVTSSA